MSRKEIIILVVIAAVVGFYLYWESKNKSEEDTEQTEQPQVLEEPAPTLPVVDPNPVSDNLPAVNPADKTNPFKDINTNPFK